LSRPNHLSWLHELRSLIGSANSQFKQQSHMLIAGVAGAVLGLILWYPGAGTGWRRR